MSRRRPVDRQEIEDLYEDGLRFTVEYPTAAGVACAARDIGNETYSMVVAIELEASDGTPVTPRLLAKLPEQARVRVCEAVAVRACMHAHGEIDRSYADRHAP